MNSEHDRKNKQKTKLFTHNILYRFAFLTSNVSILNYLLNLITDFVNAHQIFDANSARMRFERFELNSNYVRHQNL